MRSQSYKVSWTLCSDVTREFHRLSLPCIFRFSVCLNLMPVSTWAATSALVGQVSISRTDPARISTSSQGRMSRKVSSTEILVNFGKLSGERQNVAHVAVNRISSPFFKILL